MTENLNYNRDCANTTWVTNTDTAWCGCYNNSSTLCDTYGKLYQWSAAMNNNTSTTQGVCPDGWHIPTDTEWTVLTDYINSNIGYRCNGTNSYIAKSLASTYGWVVNTTTCAIGNNQFTNNSSGFNALPAGNRYGDGNFRYLSYHTLWWSSSIIDGVPIDRYISLHLPHVGRKVYYYFTYALSVRCIKD